MKNKFIIPQFKEVLFKISKGTINPKTHFYQIDAHIHGECEIYINVSGDVSFYVNGNTYPMSRGDVFIARPGDIHHCVYRSNSTHRNYWVLFDYENNKKLFDEFWDTPFENVVRPDTQSKERILKICDDLAEKDIGESERFFKFFEMLFIIKNSKSVKCADRSIVPEIVFDMLDYINANLNQKITVCQIAQNHYLSISSVARYFEKYTGLTPLEYIKKQKLRKSAELLRGGHSVSGAGEAVGYTDNSYFIELFKKEFGVTPLCYKNKFRTGV